MDMPERSADKIALIHPRPEDPPHPLILLRSRIGRLHLRLVSSSIVSARCTAAPLSFLLDVLVIIPLGKNLVL